MSSNALATTSRTALAQAGVVNPFLKMAEEMGGGHSIYMKFNGNSGEFTVGQEAEEIPHGSELAADIANIRVGWICWKEGEVVQEIMVLVNDANSRVPLEHELPDHGPYVQTAEQKDGWSKQSALKFRNLTDGEEYVFKAASESARGALRDLMKSYGAQMAFHENETPIVSFSVRSFMPKNKQWGKKYAPIFKIVKWVPTHELVAAVDGEDAGDYEQPQSEAPTQAAAPAQTQAVAPPAQQAAPPAQQAAAPADTAEKPRPAEARGARRRTFG